VRLAFE